MLRRQRARPERRAGPQALGTGAWSLMLLGPKGGSATMAYTHALNSGPSQCVARQTLCSGVKKWFSDPIWARCEAPIIT